MEYRYTELKSSDDHRTVSGMAFEWGKLYEERGRFKEVLRRGAFGKVADQDITATVAHKRDRIIGRTGSNLFLKDTERGLEVELKLDPELPEQKSTIQLLERRLLRGFSIEYSIHTAQRLPNQAREILQGRLYTISVVDRNSYKGTDAKIRWVEDDEENAQIAIALGWY